MFAGLAPERTILELGPPRTQPHPLPVPTTPPTVLTARKSSGRSSSSSPFRIFSRVLMEISRSFSWWWFSRSRHWAIVQSS